MERSLQDYEGTVTLVNHVVTTSYILIKYMVGPVLWFVLERADRRRSGRRRQKKCSCLTLGKFARITQPMQSIILLLFSKQLPIKQYADDRDSNNVPKMTLYGKRLSYGAMMVLFVIISTFWVLTLGSALNASLLSVTHVCSEEWNIDCYPVLRVGANDTGLLNITTSKPIRNCSLWSSEDVVDRVVFVCYQYILDAEKFLSVIGGLLATFIYATKTIIALLRCLSVHVCCCLGGGHKAAESTSSNRRHRRCCIILFASRIVMSVIVAISETVVAILGYVFGVTATTAHINEHTSNLVYFLARNAIDFLLVFGVLSALLWLPWEEYATDYKEEDEEKEHSAYAATDVELHAQLVQGGGAPQEYEDQQGSGKQQKSGNLLETVLESGDKLEIVGKPDTAVLLETEA